MPLRRGTLKMLRWATVKEHDERNGHASIIDLAAKRWYMWAAIHQRLVSMLHVFASQDQIDKNNAVVSKKDMYDALVADARELVAHAAIANAINLSTDASLKAQLTAAKRYCKDTFLVSTFKGAKLKEKLKDDDLPKSAAPVVEDVSTAEPSSSSGSKHPAPVDAKAPAAKKPKFLQKKGGTPTRGQRF